MKRLVWRKKLMSKLKLNIKYMKVLRLHQSTLNIVVILFKNDSKIYAVKIRYYLCWLYLQGRWVHSRCNFADKSCTKGVIINKTVVCFSRRRDGREVLLALISEMHCTGFLRLPLGDTTPGWQSWGCAARWTGSFLIPSSPVLSLRFVSDRLRLFIALP